MHNTVQSFRSSEINFHFLSPAVVLKERKRLKAFIYTKVEAHKHAIDTIDIILCSDDYLLDINRRFLKHDFLTDIITFDNSEKSGHIRSDVFVSVDRVRENAKFYGVSLKEELHRVIFHGILHLLGYKDKTSKDVAVMRQNEQLWLREYFGDQD